MISTVLPKTPDIQPSASPRIPRSPEEKTSDIDFQSLLMESNRVRNDELEKEKIASGKGELAIGESKTDAEFREMLEKVTGKKQDKNKTKLEKDDYINLMVTQLKYQDPTKPMDNQEMATQLAQFNTVEQLMSSNKILSDLKASLTSSGADKLTHYIGKTIEVSSTQLRLGADGKQTSGRFNSTADTGSSNVEIKDASGTTVRTMALGGLKSGNHEFTWDGKDDKGDAAKAGQYSFKVNATSQDGKVVNIKSSILTTVDGVSDLASGGKLETTAGLIELKDILAVRNAPTKPTSGGELASGPMTGQAVLPNPASVDPAKPMPVKEPQVAQEASKNVGSEVQKNKSEKRNERLI